MRTRRGPSFPDLRREDSGGCDWDPQEFVPDVLEQRYPLAVRFTSPELRARTERVMGRQEPTAIGVIDMALTARGETWGWCRARTQARTLGSPMRRLNGGKKLAQEAAGAYPGRARRARRCGISEAQGGLQKEGPSHRGCCREVVRCGQTAPLCLTTWRLWGWDTRNAVRGGRNPV